MIYTIRPKDFAPVFEVVSCFVIYDGKIFLLHRQSYKPDGGTWGTVAGKIDATDTSPLAAIERELYEETGLHVQANDIHYHTMLFVRSPERDFPYYIFSTNLTALPTITIQPKEHSEYTWVTPQQAVTMSLVPDMKEVVMDFFTLKVA